MITIPKQSAEDTSFTTTNAAGEKRTIPVPKGTYVTVHTPGLHNNRTSYPHSCSSITLVVHLPFHVPPTLPNLCPPLLSSILCGSALTTSPPLPSLPTAKYWEDPDAFKPGRFLKDYPRDCFLPFSGGPRGCIGRGFSETESIAVLTLLISRYRVEVRREPRFAGETFEQTKARLLKSKLSVTL